ncbi:TetR/AcrR family transcriptional regulator [Actinoallomurus liliacearum]|uniref:TetR/AcrR family transcriptional regulator n=1 Tax=Actinoallomurus liliacearum TaxID=1080073 RepID=A0ABP8TTF8_9ACTN
MSRRRGERLEQAILDVAWDLLTRVGYARLTMEAVAAEAGTSRPVIHRRWPTRASLALAALEHAAPAETEAPDTGTLRTDLLALMGQVAHRLGTVHGEVLAGIVAETARDPDATHALRTRMATTAQGHVVATIVQRAVDRGEIPTIRLPERVAKLPFDLIRNEVVLYGNPPGQEVIAEIVHSIILPSILQASATETGAA